MQGRIQDFGKGGGNHDQGTQAGAQIAGGGGLPPPSPWPSYYPPWALLSPPQALKTFLKKAFFL